MSAMKTRTAWRWPSALGLVLMAALVLTGGGLITWMRWRAPDAESLPVYGPVPDFSLVERSGRIITRADLLGKVSVVDFFYTQCPDTCPLLSAHLARLQAAFSGAPDLLLVSITVDPDHDTRQALAAYAERFHADPHRWLFLTGPREAIYHLAVDGFHLAVIGSGPAPMRPAWAWLAPHQAFAHDDEEAGPKVTRVVHASRFALVDRQARLRGYFDGTDWADVERLQKDAGRLLAEHGRRNPPPAAPPGPPR
jgi:protein SCO1/2